MDNIIKYLPPVVAELQELQQICDTETEELKQLRGEIEYAQDSQYVPLADASGLTRLEKAYGLPNTGGDLDDRRLRILSKLNDVPPYSMGWLRKKLDTLLDGYSVALDRSINMLTIEGDATTDGVIDSLHHELRRTIPANIILNTSAVVAIPARQYCMASMSVFDDVEVR